MIMSDLRSGFTLLELIIVLIIVGVLASVSITLVGYWIHKSNAAEGLMYLESIKDPVNTCIAKTGVGIGLVNIANCVNTTVRSSAPSQNFTIDSYGSRMVPGDPLSSNGIYEVYMVGKNDNDFVNQEPNCGSNPGQGSKQSGVGWCHDNNGNDNFFGWGMYANTW